MGLSEFLKHLMPLIAIPWSWIEIEFGCTWVPNLNLRILTRFACVCKMVGSNLTTKFIRVCNKIKGWWMLGEKVREEERTRNIQSEPQISAASAKLWRLTGSEGI